MSTTEVRAPYLVAVMGFGGFEQQALDSYLGLARARRPAYAPCTSIEEAHFIIANGDRVGVLDLLAAAQRTGDTVFVGPAPVAGAAAVLARPVDPAQLFRTLDDAVKHRSLAATAARANPRNMTMAELSMPWALDEARGAAFYAPAAPRLATPLPGVLPPQLLGRHAGDDSTVSALEREAWARGPRAPGRQTVHWSGTAPLPSDVSLPGRQAAGRRHADRAGDDTPLASAQARLPGDRAGGGVGVANPRAMPDRARASLALVSNEEPELSAEAVLPLRAPSPRMPAPQPATEILSALVVDEREGSALLPLFEAQRVKATCVAKAHHAFAMLDVFAFDVVLIDVELGSGSDLDGLQVCRAIQRRQLAPGEFCPPVVLMSAKPSALEQARCMLAGGNVYLSKPVRPGSLAQALVHAGARPAWTLAEVDTSASAGR